MESLYVVIDPSPGDGEHLEATIHRLQPRSRVFRTSSGSQAIEELAGLRAAPSLLFTAFETDDMNAIELLGALRERRWLATTPVAVVTDAIDDRLMVQTYRLGAAVFLEKPVAQQDLREAIREHGRPSQWLAAATIVRGTDSAWRRAA